MKKIRLFLLNRKVKKLYSDLNAIQIYLAYYKESEEKIVQRNMLVKKIKEVESKIKSLK